MGNCSILAGIDRSGIPACKTLPGIAGGFWLHWRGHKPHHQLSTACPTAVPPSNPTIRYLRIWDLDTPGSPTSSTLISPRVLTPGRVCVRVFEGVEG